VVVKRGTQRLEPSLYGTPLPVDPGEYSIEVSAPGYETWTTPIKVESGGASASVRVPGLVKRPEDATPPPSAQTPPGQAPDLTLKPQPARAAKQGLSTGQTLGLVVGGVGVIGLGLGSYFGVRAISKNSDAEGYCNSDNLCSQPGLDLTDKAKKDATAANIAFAVGGALVAVGGVVFLSSGSRDSDRVALVPLLGPRSAAASISGRF
jgi:serine/threonine-protein kinase